MLANLQHAPRFGDQEASLHRLLEEGYCIASDIVPTSTIAALNRDLDEQFATTPFCEGGFYGSRTKRFGGLVRRSRYAASLIQHDLILNIAKAVLGPWCDAIQLNLTQAVEIHPGELAQFPHRDQDMWWGEIGKIEYLINVMWPFTEYRHENGATLIWPNSHGANSLAPECDTSPIVAECDPGSAIVFLGSTLHGAGGNESSKVRRGMIVSYCLGWLKPYENQWLVYPPDVARHFDPELASLIGYRQHRPNLNNYEGRCPSILLSENVPDRLSAIDALRPHQEMAVTEYVRRQQRTRGQG